jgi:hypothetical protein
MNQNIRPRPPAIDPATSPPAEHLLRHHAAFCRMALPLHATDGDWRRDVGTAAIRIASTAGDLTTPSGRFLRLILMHVCDAALLAGSPVVEMGQGAAMLATAIGVEMDGPELDELADEVDRLVSAKVAVSLAGGPFLTVFDARSNPRLATKWRRSIRLNARFHAGLAGHSVPLDRRIVTALAASSTALDAYAWIRHSLADLPEGQVAGATWEDLQHRFGEPDQDSATFKTGFEDALRRVFVADLSISIAVDDEGISVRHARPKDDDDVQEGPRTAAPVQSQEAERAEPVLPLPSTAPARGGQPEPSPEVRPQSSGRSGVGPAAGPEPLHMVSLRSNLTGLPQVVWLRRASGDRHIVIGVTPGAHLDTDRLTILTVEPIVMQVSGGVPEPVFERVSAWVMANRDLIDDFWESRIDTAEEVFRRVRKAPAVGWR